MLMEINDLELKTVNVIKQTVEYRISTYNNIVIHPPSLTY